MINYIKILNRSILVNKDSKNHIYNMTLNRYLDNILLNQLTTLDGRIKAIRVKYKYSKLTPIYINKELILIPLFKKNSIDNIYINIISIKDIIENSIIYFDNCNIVVSKKRSSLIKAIKRAKTIEISD